MVCLETLDDFYDLILVTIINVLIILRKNMSNTLKKM